MKQLPPSPPPSLPQQNKRTQVRVLRRKLTAHQRQLQEVAGLRMQLLQSQARATGLARDSTQLNVLNRDLVERDVRRAAALSEWKQSACARLAEKDARVAERGSELDRLRRKIAETMDGTTQTLDERSTARETEMKEMLRVKDEALTERQGFVDALEAELSEKGLSLLSTAQRLTETQGRMKGVKEELCRKDRELRLSLIRVNRLSAEPGSLRAQLERCREMSTFTLAGQTAVAAAKDKELVRVREEAAGTAEEAREELARVSTESAEAEAQLRRELESAKEEKDRRVEEVQGEMVILREESTRREMELEREVADTGKKHSAAVKAFDESVEACAEGREALKVELGNRETARQRLEEEVQTLLADGMSLERDLEDALLEEQQKSKQLAKEVRGKTLSGRWGVEGGG